MINITIDGNSGCGKSSTAREVAEKLNFLYLDTGAMYRAVTLAVLQQNIDLQEGEKVVELLSNTNIKFSRPDGNLVTLLNGKNVESEIRTMEVSNFVSEVSKLEPVRSQLVKWQREMAAEKGVVMEGRDVGTVVLPDAELKIFMTAEIEVRAKRREAQLRAQGKEAKYEEIFNNLRERDRIDSTRGIAPLRKAEGAIEIDTTFMTFDEQVNKIVELAKNLL